MIMKTEKRSRISRVLMLLQNAPYPHDPRVRGEARALVTAGYQVTLICPGVAGQPRHEMLDGVRIYRFPRPPYAGSLMGYLYEYGYSMVAIFVISLLVLVRHGFDVVHAHCPPDAFVFIAACYKLMGKRFVYDHHDLSPELYYARFRGSGNLFIYRTLVFLERFACRLADHVIATNQSYKQVEMVRGSVPEERITIVRNGPDLNHSSPADPDRDLDQPGRTILCYVGVMGVQDGVDYLLRAMQYLVYEMGRNDLFCYLVGRGEAVPRLEILTEQLGLSEYVLFTGWVDRAEVPGYISAADICVAPEPSNPYNDRSTSIKVMEYMQHSKPIVAFDLPEHRFSAQDAAVYAHPNDEQDFAQRIAALIDDPVQCQRMGQAGRDRIESELAWSYQKQHLLDAYRALGGEPSGH
jgi:glycosyltransferase involved in cell wall biosynthesis